MLLDEIYLFLKTAGYAQTQAAFSKEHLGHSLRYYDYLRCSGAQPSLKCLVKLALRLSEISSVATGPAERDTTANLARRVTSVIFERCV